MEDALEAWRGLAPSLRLRILSTTGGCSPDEYRIIETSPKPTHDDYRVAQAVAAALLRAAAEPEANTNCECGQPLAYDGAIYCGAACCALSERRQ